LEGGGRGVLQIGEVGAVDDDQAAVIADAAGIVAQEALSSARYDGCSWMPGKANSAWRTISKSTSDAHAAHGERMVKSDQQLSGFRHLSRDPVS
jgi:hypothetical protein